MFWSHQSPPPTLENPPWIFFSEDFPSAPVLTDVLISPVANTLPPFSGGTFSKSQEQSLLKSSPLQAALATLFFRPVPDSISSLSSCGPSLLPFLLVALAVYLSPPLSLCCCRDCFPIFSVDDLQFRLVRRLLNKEVRVLPPGLHVIQITSILGIIEGSFSTFCCPF